MARRPWPGCWRSLGSVSTSLGPGSAEMRGCQHCGRIYAPRLAPARCGECGGALALLALVDALALAHGRQDRLRRERAQRLWGDAAPERLGAAARHHP